MPGPRPGSRISAGPPSIRSTASAPTTPYPRRLRARLSRRRAGRRRAFGWRREELTVEVRSARRARRRRRNRRADRGGRAR
jgi:hypothetical protein